MHRPAARALIIPHVRVLTNVAPAEKPGAEKKCAGCRTQYYCDAKCQRVHWKAEHKKECKSWAQK